MTMEVRERTMTNKFKAALAATSLAGAIIATGAEVDINNFEVGIVQNEAAAAIVSEAVANAKPVEPSIILARTLQSNREGGNGSSQY